MDYVFSAIGGSGSRFLIRRLSERYDVGDKPDTVFRPKFKELRIADINTEQGTFEERAHGFTIHSDETMDQAIARYLVHLRKGRRRTAVFNTCAELGVFSRIGASNVVFLIRHPLHTYLSWGKKERHGDVLEYLGGMEATSAIEWFARRWNRQVTEMFDLQRTDNLGGVIRYEYAKRDARALRDLNWVFAQFDSARRNHGMLSLMSERRLRQLTGDLYSRLYDAWEL